ncbi:hypothetical protein HDE_00825 [Halotydeus destructor]|nr:hypothetical protein HDE_00825 [Halotydeus destructor]
MALTIMSILTTVILVCGYISRSSWSTNRTEPENGVNSEPKRSSYHGSPFNVPQPVMYPYHYHPSMGYYYGRRPMAQRRQQFSDRIGRGYSPYPIYHGEDYGGGGSGVEKNQEFYYILPILLVIGLGSFLIPIISTFFTAMITTNGTVGGCCGRKRRRGDKVKPLLAPSVEKFWDILVGSLDSTNSSAIHQS